MVGAQVPRLGLATRSQERERPSGRSNVPDEHPSLRGRGGGVTSTRVRDASPPCAICGHCGRGPRSERHLTHGICVWLCHAHDSDAFIKRRAGNEFVERLASVWAASGVLTSRRRDALTAHLRRIQTGTTQRTRPGSYSWPMLRREAERRFATGEPPAAVITDLRENYRDGPAMVPSIRTMRRWFTQARWLATPPTNRRNQPRPMRPQTDSQWRPLVDVILTGSVKARPSRAQRHPRGP